MANDIVLDLLICSAIMPFELSVISALTYEVTGLTKITQGLKLQVTWYRFIY